MNDNAKITIDSAELRQTLINNISHFSAFKEASFRNTLKDLLVGNDRIPRWSDFEKAAAPITNDYNVRWLATEFNQTVGSARSALQWKDYQTRVELYPNLRYDAVMDGRTRVQHAAWNGLVLPLSHPFWKTHYPPSDWECRCGTEQTDDEQDTKGIDFEDLPPNKSGLNHNPGITGKIFDDGHPYYDVPKAEKAEIEDRLNNYNIPALTPKSLADYEKQLGVEIDKSMFSLLQKETPLLFENPAGTKLGKGAFFHPRENYVKIPIDARRKNSKWYSKAVVHHEYGHAIDEQIGLRANKRIADIMNSARKMYSATDCRKIYLETVERAFNAKSSGDFDEMEKNMAILDTIASFRPTINMNRTHPNAYWKIPGMKEAEFIAHLFENKYATNDAFEKAMPELYKIMREFDFN